MERRSLLQTGLAALAGVVARPGTGVGVAPVEERRQTAPAAGPTQSRTLGAHPLGGVFDGWQGNVLEVTYRPGASSAAHRHPGPTFGYVVRGRIRWAIDGQPAVELGPGQAFFEPMGSVHSTSANASDSEPATIAVVILARPGEPLSRPVPAPDLQGRS